MSDVSHHSLTPSTPALKSHAPRPATVRKVKHLARLTADVLYPNLHSVMWETNTPDAVMLRSVVVWLSFKTVTENMAEISRAMGRHHTFALYALPKVDAIRATDPEFRERTNRLLDLAVERMEP